MGRAVAAPAELLPTVEVAPGVHVYAAPYEDFSPANRGGIANLVLVTGDEAAAVIDTGGSPQFGARWLATVRALTTKPIRYVIMTHVHPDHVFGDAAFGGTGAVFVGHGRLPAALADRGPFYAASLSKLLERPIGPEDIILPEILVDVGASRTLDLGNRPLELRAWPTAHTDTDLTVLDRRTGTLICGDLLFIERIPVVDGSLKGWLATLDELATIDAERAIPGHGPPAAPWPAALAPERDYLKRLLEGVRGILAKGVPLQDAVAALPMDDAGWSLAAENHPRNVVAAYKELEWE